MLGHNDILIQEERSRELLRQAEHERLLRQILGSRNQQHRLYRRALSWLGSRMVDWGQGLQERYGRAAPAS